MVYTNIVELAKNGSIVAFRIVNEKTQKLVATGKGQFALVDIQSSRSVPIPDWVIERYSIPDSI